MSDIVRVLRIIEYVGEREWVEKTVANSIQGTKFLGRGNYIAAATIGSYPEILYQTNPVPQEEIKNGEESNSSGS